MVLRVSRAVRMSSRLPSSLIRVDELGQGDAVPLGHGPDLFLDLFVAHAEPLPVGDLVEDEAPLDVPGRLLAGLLAAAPRPAAASRRPWGLRPALEDRPGLPLDQGSRQIQGDPFGQRLQASSPLSRRASCSLAFSSSPRTLARRPARLSNSPRSLAHSSVSSGTFFSLMEMTLISYSISRPASFFWG